MTETVESKGTVLVVEDDPDFSEYVTATLGDHGYATEVVMDGDSVMERAKAIMPAAITLDIMLPGRTGIACYRWLRTDEATRNIPIVIVSGVGTEGKHLALERFFKGRTVAAPEGVLQKPVEPEELQRAVDAAIARKAA